MTVEPIPMVLHCPECLTRHVDEGEFATKAHHTHSCQCCGLTWRPAVVPTVGVQFLPGFKNDVPMRRWCCDPECLSFDCSTCIEVNAMARTAARVVAIESAAGFVVRRAGLAATGGELRARIEALREAMNGAADDGPATPGRSEPGQETKR